MDQPTECGNCGEGLPVDDSGFYLGEVGEFVKPDGEHVVAHAQCGLSLGWELA